MRIQIDIGHPAHVHFFKNFIWEMQKKGHEFKLTARDKDVSIRLLDAYGLPYIPRGKGFSGLLGKIRGLVEIDSKIYNVSKAFKPDVLLGIHNPYTAQISRLIGAKSITFTDSEPVIASHLTYPFTDVICTPECFRKNLGKKHVRYNGYHELAYLHPNYFTPNPSVLDELNLSKQEKFFILRFVSWEAHHDVGKTGFTNESKIKLVKELEKHGRVLVTSEKKTTRELEKYTIPIGPEKIHDLLYYATMLVGDTQTMTTEAAVLGTPAIRCNSFVGPNDMGNFIELENKYGLILNFTTSEEAIKTAVELSSNAEIKTIWQLKRERLLHEKIDLTDWMLNYIQSN